MIDIYSSSRNKQGFTLVELSIVLVIIGLLIGGILVGQSLVESTENMKIMKDVENMKISQHLFYDKTKCIAGDCDKSFIPSNRRGDGNKIIYGGNRYPEPIRVRYHMQLMGMEDSNEDLTICNQTYDYQKKPCHKEGVIKNSIFVYHSSIVGINGNPSIGTYTYNMPDEILNSTWLTFGNRDDSHPNGPGQMTGIKIFTPVRAIAIDKKYDDGKPNDGNIMMNTRHNTGSGCTTDFANNPATQYILDVDEVTCTLMFFIHDQGNFESY